MSQTPGPQDSIEILSANEVAAMLGVDRKTIYEAARNKQIPHRRLGRRLIFERQSLVSWLRDQPENG